MGFRRSTPHTEWHNIDARHDSFRNSLTHIPIGPLSLPSAPTTPPAHRLETGVGEPITLTADSAPMLSIAAYVTLIIGVPRSPICTGWVIPSAPDPSYTTSLELAALHLHAAVHGRLSPPSSASLVRHAYRPSSGSPIPSTCSCGVPILMHIPKGSRVHLCQPR